MKKGSEDKLEVVAIIPARGDSKRIPSKNVLPIAGKPLIVHSIEAANEARAKGEIEKLQVAAQEYKMKYGSYPGVSTDVPNLIENLVPDLTNFMVETVSYIDPWKNPYQYVKHSRHSGIFYSFGHNGIDGDDDDIHSGR